MAETFCFYAEPGRVVGQLGSESRGIDVGLGYIEGDDLAYIAVTHEMAFAPIELSRSELGDLIDTLAEIHSEMAP